MLALAAGFAFGSYHLAYPSTHWGCADLCGPNATLACVQSSEENERVARLAADAGVIHFWVGSYQRPAGEEPGGGWDVCQSGETVNFAKWYRGPQPIWQDGPQPDNWHGAEACAAVSHSHHLAEWPLLAEGWWYDLPCYLELPCLCKHGAADPSKALWCGGCSHGSPLDGVLGYSDEI